MKERDYKQNIPDEQEEESYDFYETGSTRPPKSRSGLIALVLILGIILVSILSFLGGLRSNLFQKLDHLDDPEGDDVSLAVEMPTILPETQPQDITDRPRHPGDTSVELGDTPASVDTPSQTGGLSLQKIYEDSINSVVSIVCTSRDGVSSGTGVILSENGYIITNAHVVSGAASVSVMVADGTEYVARLMGLDQVSDLAVLYVEAKNLTPARFGNSDAMRVGDTVVAIGDPLGTELRGTMTNGIVSAINRDISVGGRVMTVIQTNAALNSGNSGGPLINCYGQVIGINTMKIGDSINAGSVEGLGFAIPSTTVKHVVDQLIRQGYVSGRPGLGVTLTEVSSLYQYYYSVPAGLYVSDIQPGSDAQSAGLRVQDILLGINNTRIRTMEDLNRVLHPLKVGDTVEAVLFRGGSEYHCQLRLVESKA